MIDTARGIRGAIRARIVELQVQGVGAFQDRRALTFRRPDGRPIDTLVIAGPNGCGKTALLEAILYALGREELLRGCGARVRLTLEVSSAPGTVLGPWAPCVVELTRTLDSWSVRAEGDGGARLVSDDPRMFLEIAGHLPVRWFSSRRMSYLPGPVRPMQDAPAAARGEAGRLWRIKQRVVDARTRAAFGAAPGSAQRESDADGWLDRLSAAWRALSGDDDLRLIVRADESDADPTCFDIYVHRGPGRAAYSVDQLSSGELEWLVLAGTLITADFEGIVLIDEPELHLHPEWQARILPALRSVVPESQIIIASHADAPWDQVYSFERVLLGGPGTP